MAIRIGFDERFVFEAHQIRQGPAGILGNQLSVSSLAADLSARKKVIRAGGQEGKDLVLFITEHHK